MDSSPPPTTPTTAGDADAPRATPMADGLYLFISIDLVNSTVFKTREEIWPQVLSYFYRLTRREIGENIERVRVWKYVGDEVLFYLRLERLDDVCAMFEKVAGIAQSITRQLNNVFPVTENVLFVKTTMWSAVCEHLPAKEVRAGDHQRKNLIIQVEGLAWNEVETSIDFVGPDIDIGFRVARFAHKRLITLSADLAALAFHHGAGPVCDHIRIVSYEQLKGVWQDRHYPIVWYYDAAWKEIHNAFLYDDRFDNALVARMYPDPDAQVESPATILQVLTEAGQADSYHRSLAILKEPPTKAVIETIVPIREKCSEVHCVAICFDDKGRILLGKRPATKKVLAGAWEFGCSQLRFGQDFGECLAEAYLGDFGAELGRVWPDPVRTYVVEKGERVIPGLMFVAEVVNPGEIEQAFDRRKHTEIKWFDPGELEGIDPAAYVPDFQDSVRAAVALYRGEEPVLRGPVEP